MQRLDSSLFDFSTWRAGTILDLGVQTRYADIMAKRTVLAMCVLGYCPGDLLPCRPKPGEVAVMFQKADGVLFWQHLRLDEFRKVSELESSPVGIRV